MKGEGATDDAIDKDGVVPLQLQELKDCELREMARDRIKSRLLQKTLAKGSEEVVRLVLEKAEPHVLELARDARGSYLVQKMLEVAPADQFDSVFSVHKAHFADLAQDNHGTRTVQKAVEQAVARGRASELVEAMPASLIDKLSRSVSGFHVIVKLADTLPDDEVEGLVSALCGTPERAVSLGKDQWGCCVLKKCIDRAGGTAGQKLVDAITENAQALVQDPFGNYVVQHVILTRPNPSVGRIIESLRGHMFELSLQKFSSNVLEKCLLHATEKDRNTIINEILNPPNCLPSEAVRLLFFHQFGNYVLQQALEVAKEPHFSLLIEHSKPHIRGIVVNKSPELMQEGNLSPEHAHRLAAKLMKKYAVLSAGLEMYMLAFQRRLAAGRQAQNWKSEHCDPVAFGATGAEYAFDYYGGWASGTWGHHPVADGWAAAAPSSYGDGIAGAESTMGRIVGFWPNYSVTYDQVPSALGTPAGAGGGAGAGSGGRGGRPKNKARSGKAEPSGTVAS